MAYTNEKKTDVARRECTEEFGKLIGYARNGSNEALGQLLESHRKYLLWLANREMSNDVRAKGGGSDMVQQTFLAAKLAFVQFRGELPHDLRAWLRVILLNNVARFHRAYLQTEKRNVQTETSLQAATAWEQQTLNTERSPSSCVQHSEDQKQLMEALESLSPEHQKVIQLRYWERLTFSEIGQRLGRSAEASRKLWSRATCQLEQAFHGGVRE